MKITKIIGILFLLFNIITISSVKAEEKIKWRLATTWGPTLSPFSDAVKNFAYRVNVLSDGQFIIKVDPSNKHKAPFGVFDFVKNSQYEMGHSASYYWKGKNFAFNIFTTLPFGMTPIEQYSWYYYGEGLDLMQKSYAKYGLMSFPGGNIGPQMGGWFKKEIKTVDDLKGLKMRIPGFAGEVLSKLGVSVTNIAPGELYTALERGTIDALEWVGPGMDIKLGFHKIANYYYEGWHEPSSELQFLVNKSAYEKLSNKNKEILKVAMKESAFDMYAHSTYLSANAWHLMKSKYKDIKVQQFPENVLDAIKKANNDLIKEKIKENKEFAEIYKSYRDFAIKARAWSNISEKRAITNPLIK